MSFVLTSESLQDISVKCVTAFMTKQASLSEAIATESKNLELNPEQIKRVIETSNTLAYLRQLKDATDRSFEFPVADYGKVMSSMSLPDATIPITSQVSASVPCSGSIEKVASVSEYDGVSLMEKRALLIKEALICKENLVKMAEEKEMLKQKLEKSANAVSKDPLGLEKLAQVSFEEDFNKLVYLCKLEKRAEVDSIFVDNELKDARLVNSLYKEAKALLEKEASMSSFVSEVERILFSKEAGIIGKALGKAVKGGAWLFGKAVKGTGNAIKEAVDPKGFAATGKRVGYKSTEDAVKGFDHISATQGKGAALDRFSGHSPNTLLHRVGVGGIMTATAGSGIQHKNNVWNDLNS